MPTIIVPIRNLKVQSQWLCTSPASGVKEDRFNAAGAQSVIIRAINHECARAIAASHGLRLDGKLIT